MCGWLVGWSVLVCAFVCAFVSAFVCSFRGLFAYVLSWVHRVGFGGTSDSKIRSSVASENMGVKNTKGPCRSAGGASL